MALWLLALALVSVTAQFSATDKQQILDQHNNLRSQIALGKFTAKGKLMPAAADMRRMIWSSALEFSAQAYANKCVFKHSGQTGVGENLYMAWSSVTNTISGKGAAASAAWAKEFQDFGWSSVYFDMNVFNSGVGHATQMAWAKSNQIGCGAALCDSKKSVIVVCQYQSQGNYLNTNAYTTGTTCSKCPTGTTCQTATGLCA